MGQSPQPPGCLRSSKSSNLLELVHYGITWTNGLAINMVNIASKGREGTLQPFSGLSSKITKATREAGAFQKPWMRSQAPAKQTRHSSPASRSGE